MLPPPDAPPVINLLGFLDELQLLKYLDAATLAVLTMEYLATLPLEVRLIWPIRLSHIKVLYFLNRHVVWVSVVAPRLSSSTKCHTMNTLANCARVATVLVSEALLFARVWALSGNESLLGAWLFGFWLAAGTAAFALIVMFSMSAIYDLSPYPSIVTCIPIYSQTKFSIPAVALIFLEQVFIMLLSFYYGLRRHGTSGSHLGRIMYRDGLLYFVALTVLAILNVTLQLTTRSNLRYALNTFHFAMHAVLCNRMVLHLRSEAREKMGFTTQYDISTLDLGSDNRTLADASTSDFSQRLNTNYVPSDSELLVLKRWIEDREALAAILAAKMEETKSSGNALVEMEEELAAHRQFIVDHRMLTSPIRRIPLDVLSLIFQTCLEPRPTDSPPCRSSAKISHVCAGWRQLALNTPSLWTHTYVETPKLNPEWTPWLEWCVQMEALLHHVKARIDRSSSSPIDLSLRIGGVSPGVRSKLGVRAIEAYQTVFDMLGPTTSRWRSIFCTWEVQRATRGVIELFGGPHLQFSLLRKVRFHVYGEDIGETARKALLDKLFQSTLFAAPLLRDVALSGPWSNIANAKAYSSAPLYDSITHFAYSVHDNDSRVLFEPKFDTAQALDVLRALPNLTTVQIVLHSIGPASPPPLTPISLPHLKSMALRHLPIAKGFAPSLHLPGLVSLQLNCSEIPYNYQSEDAENNGFEELLLRWGSQLRELTMFYNGIAQQALPRCLAMLSNVRSLRLCSTNVNVIRVNDEADRDLLSKLSSPGILPRLEELELHDLSNQSDGAVEGAVVGLLERRIRGTAERDGQRGGASTQGALFLRRVHIRFIYDPSVDIPGSLRNRSACLDDIDILLEYHTSYAKLNRILT